MADKCFLNEFVPPLRVSPTPTKLGNFGMVDATGATFCGRDGHPVFLGSPLRAWMMAAKITLKAGTLRTMPLTPST